ncbi:MAG TPA: family 10 glycosylhydrolase [Vicinamibacterales bacterium]|nr:family 10 glycosylhydrolase [Vicinamibacterales bacterium]
MRPFRALAGVAALIGLALAASTPAPAASPQDAPTEIRALWVLRTSLSSPDSIAELVRSAHGHGFNTLLVQVRGRGDRYYANGIEPRASDLVRQPLTFDPLASVIAAARTSGLSVHAWVNVNLVSSAADLPIARTHIVHRHPEWLMVPRDIAQELARIDQRSPAYVGRLARWTRGQDNVEGLYATPIVPAAAAHVEAVVRDIAARYVVDGIHLDYARFPSSRFDYSRSALAEFRAAVRPGLSPAVRTELDGRHRIDLFAYADGLPEEWKAFRMERMTALMTRVRAAVKAARPRALVTVAAAPDIKDAFDHKLQNWPAWLDAGLVDAVAPMAYTPEPARFAQQIAAASGVAGGGAIWAGIGAYRLTPAQTIDNIQTARRLGTAGIVLFSYDSLIDPKQTPANYLAVVGRSAFTASSAPGSQ